MKILGLVGSLRRASLHRRLMCAAERSLSHGNVLVSHEIGALPLYNADLDEDPEVLTLVQDFKAAIADADAVLIASPEYNYGVSGPLKNALDWASRPAYASVFARKKVGIMSLSTGPGGGVRGQGQLKQILLGLLAVPFPYPELALPHAAAKFDAAGELADEGAQELVARFVNAFEAWVTESPPAHGARH